MRHTQTLIYVCQCVWIEKLLHLNMEFHVVIINISMFFFFCIPEQYWLEPWYIFYLTMFLSCLKILLWYSLLFTWTIVAYNASDLTFPSLFPCRVWKNGMCQKASILDGVFYFTDKSIISNVQDSAELS